MWIVVSEKICLILRCQSWKYGGWNKGVHQEVHKCCHVLECHGVAGLCALCKKAGGNRTFFPSATGRRGARQCHLLVVACISVGALEEEHVCS